MSLNWQKDIEDFHKTFGQYIGDSPSLPPLKDRLLRSILVKEEMQELLDAIALDNLEGIADGGGDSIVVILGTLITYGINMQPIWDEIHKSNMAKVGGEKREDGKVLKPEGWESPKIREELVRQGMKDD